MKKIISVLFALSVIFSSFAISVYGFDSFVEKELYFGDIDDDDTINAEDALIVLKHAAKLTLIDESLQERADVNGDGYINASDALEILKYAAHVIDEFPVQPTDTPVPTVEVTETPICVYPTETPTIVPTVVPTETPTIKPTETGDTEMPEDFSGTVWIFGDSIAANHEKTASVRPLYGWGELIGEYFTDDVTFRNHAISSQSTSSYYNLNKLTYDYVFNFMKEKDYVFISFGHNDHNTAKLNGFDRTTDPEASSDTEYSYKWWLKNYYIDPVLEKGCTPILMSSVVRCTFENGVFYEEDIHMKYGVAMEELVAEYAAKGITVYYIDAQDYTYNYYSTLTPGQAQLLHGQYGGEGRGFFDNTHYCEAGARMVIDYMISELKKTDLSIMKFCKE